MQMSSYNIANVLYTIQLSTYYNLQMSAYNMLMSSYNMQMSSYKHQQLKASICKHKHNI